MLSITFSSNFMSRIQDTRKPCSMQYRQCATRCGSLTLQLSLSRFFMLKNNCIIRKWNCQ